MLYFTPTTLIAAFCALLCISLGFIIVIKAYITDGSTNQSIARMTLEMALLKVCLETLRLLILNIT